MPVASTTTLQLRQVDINDLALNDTLYYAADLSYMALDIGLSSALFGTYYIRWLKCEVRSSQCSKRGPNVARNPRGDLPYVQCHTHFSRPVFNDKPPYLYRRKGLSHTPVRILLPSTLLLYGSTILYMAALASHITSVDELTTRAQAGLFSQVYTEADVEAFQTGVLNQSWMMTIGLVTNVSPTTSTRMSELQLTCVWALGAS